MIVWVRIFLQLCVSVPSSMYVSGRDASALNIKALGTPYAKSLRKGPLVPISMDTCEEFRPVK
jgi:hypothetical protein